MGIVSQAADTYYTYRFVRTLTTDWKDQEAYEYGIIDDKGNVLRKANTLKSSAEKSSYSYFHRLVFNLKRLLEKLPFGKAKLASYAAALFLLKEETNLSQEQLREAFKEAGFDLDDLIAESSHWNIDNEDNLSPGVYSLKNDIAHPMTGEYVAKAGTKVIVPAMCEAVDNLYGMPIYKIKHSLTKTQIYVSPTDLER